MILQFALIRIALNVYHTCLFFQCLTPVFSCDGLDISTVERLGNQKDGYDVIQNRLVGFSGTQCGFCTPGFVMYVILYYNL